MHTKIFAVAVAVAVLSGCSSLGIGADDYSCKGLPEGTTCMSARDVYAATHNGAVVRSIHSETAESVVHPSQVKADGNYVGATQVWSRPATEPGSPDYLTPPLNEPQPVRTASKVMRIWIAPWEDKSGDLHASGHVYTEVEPRRWAIGHRQELSSPVLTPLQSVAPVVQTTQTSQQPPYVQPSLSPLGR